MSPRPHCEWDRKKTETQREPIVARAESVTVTAIARLTVERFVLDARPPPKGQGPKDNQQPGEYSNQNHRDEPKRDDCDSPYNRNCTDQGDTPDTWNAF